MLCSEPSLVNRSFDNAQGDTARDCSQYTHQQRERPEREIPLGRYGRPDEVAAACDLLCPERGGFIAGQVMHVNGGHYMY